MRGSWVLTVCGVLAVGGCGGKTSSLLLERHAKGPLSESALVAKGVVWQLTPQSQTQTQEQIQMIVVHASPLYLKTFFSNQEVFGRYAGINPYFAENLVFYVSIANHGSRPVRLDPQDIVLVDDRANQYSPINEDYVDALEQSREPMATTVTRDMLEDASPGYFGISIPIGKLFIRKSQTRFALIKRASLQVGVWYPNVMHDGLITFWSPSQEARTLHLFFSFSPGAQTDHAVTEPLRFSFTFQAVAQPVVLPAEPKPPAAPKP